MVASRAAYSGMHSVDSSEKRMVEKSDTLLVVVLAVRWVGRWVLKVWRSVGLTADITAGKWAFLTVLSWVVGRAAHLAERWDSE